MTDHSQKFIDHVRKVVTPMIFKADDGFDVVEFSGSGFWTADLLRIIADYLDERNKPWSDIIDSEFGKTADNTDDTEGK